MTALVAAMLMLGVFSLGVAVGFVRAERTRPRPPRFRVGYDTDGTDAVQVVLGVPGHSCVTVARIDSTATDFEVRLAEALAEARSRQAALNAGVRR